jgi:hypothetical protein
MQSYEVYFKAENATDVFDDEVYFYQCNPGHDKLLAPMNTFGFLPFGITGGNVTDIDGIAVIKVPYFSFAINMFARVNFVSMNELDYNTTENPSAKLEAAVRRNPSLATNAIVLRDLFLSTQAAKLPFMHPGYAASTWGDDEIVSIKSPVYQLEWAQVLHTTLTLSLDLMRTFR